MRREVRGTELRPDRGINPQVDCRSVNQLNRRGRERQNVIRLNRGVIGIESVLVEDQFAVRVRVGNPALNEFDIAGRELSLVALLHARQPVTVDERGNLNRGL